MAELFQFKPHFEVTASENLSLFIGKCRDELKVFGENLDWQSFVWPKIAVFAKLGVTTRKPASNECMDDTFTEFAKAYLRYQQGHNPTGTRNELKALRAVEAALIQVKGNASIDRLSIDCLDEAVVLAKQHYSSGSAYQCGREIERLAVFLSDNNLIPSNLKTWKNPIPRPSDTTKTGKEAKAVREKKLPNEIALNAIAEIFASEPSKQRDIFTTSVFAMLMAAPSRITEILTLPADCEVTEIDKNGVERYGWRFFSGKGYEGDIKWIPTVMVEVAKTAVKRAKGLSSHARKLARWIETNPDKFYRHENCPDVSDTEKLTITQACQALGLSIKDESTCRSGLKSKGLKQASNFHTLDSLWVHVKEWLPEDFPWFDKDKGIKYSNALFVLNINQFHGNRGCLPLELFKPSNNFFNNDIITRESLGGVHKSIFDRYSYFNEDGSRLKMTSKQARHLLNTMAQRGGLSNLEIAKWSGRADVKQNRTYNHMTEYELVAMAEQLDTSKSLFGPMGEVSSHFPVSIQEFNTLEQAAAHVTEYGYCVHDYTMSPCDKYRDCLNCSEQVCIKGDTVKLERIKAQLDRTEALLQKAEQGIDEGSLGADRWFTYHQKTATRLRELVSILENPEIEKGAQIKLRGNDFTQLRRVVEKKAVESISNDLSDCDEASILEDITKMLGGGIG
ncbi:integrase [Alishewanella jeotgali KCTC 22429]|uniref:Integrase n=2 Tax=Alishewanella jeotgali TaxID=545533 RepID=H3ZE45_9ALTE|nr:integrase [Alishewanella jeotgali KCTC 22429]